jgi:TolB protein
MKSKKKTLNNLLVSIAVLAIVGLMVSACAPIVGDPLAGAAGGNSNNNNGKGNDNGNQGNQNNNGNQGNQNNNGNQGNQNNNGNQGSTGPAEKVTICHATSSETNPYVIITLSGHAVFQSSGHFYEDGSPLAGHEDDFLISGNIPEGYGDIPTGSREDCGGGEEVTPTPNAKKVLICHATSSETNPYVILDISINAAFKDQGGHFYENGSPAAGHEDDFVIGSAPAEFPDVPTGTIEDCAGAVTETPTATVTPTSTPTATPSASPTPFDPPPSLEIEPLQAVCVQFILFHTFRDGDLEIYRLDGVEGDDSATLYNLSQGPNSEDSRPSRSWNDALVVFESNRDGNVELYLTDTVGSFQQRLTFTTSNNINPMFMPDNETVVFQSDRNGNWDIYSINVNTGVEVQLTTDPSDETLPFASPSTEWISYQSNRNGNNDVYLLNLTSGDTFQLTRDNSNEISPAWSPNGKYLAYLSDNAGIWDLLVYNVSTQETMNLTLGNEKDADNPSWSPEGDRIAFQSNRNGDLDVYSFDFNSSTEYKVSEHAGVDSSPTWDCGGANISFTSTRDGDANIFAAPWTGGSNGNLTTHPATDKWSEWSPSKEQASRGR